jgi:hypothetical protein
MAENQKQLKEEHTHKYQKILLGGRRIVKKDGKKYIEKCGGYEIFKCMMPGCRTWKATELVIGDTSLCWVCGGKLTLTTENTRLKRPTHTYCRKTREQVA